MNKINKIMVCIVSFLALSNASTNSFYYGDNPGGNMLGTAGTATLMGGAFSGNKAAIGAGAGLMATGALMNAGSASRERRDRDRYYRDRYDRDYDYDRSRRSSKRSYRQQQRDLERENEALRMRLQQYETE